MTPPGLLIHRITPLCQLQDLGRWGYQKFGVSCSGAMDTYSLRLANILAGNPQNTACLEFALAGAQFEVTAERLHFAFVGNFPVFINEELFPANASYTLTKGERLEIGAVNGNSGTHGYLSVLGGFDAESDLGSHSTHLRSGLGGFEQPPKRSNILRTSLDEAPTAIERHLSGSLIPEVPDVIRTVSGPQADHFSIEQQKNFYDTQWQIAQNSDRMGYRLQGNTIEVDNSGSMISEPVSPGSIQITAGGQPIVLMPDCGTVGGYPKIATVSSVDRGNLAQTPFGKKFSFEEISVETAQALYREQETRIADFV